MTDSTCPSPLLAWKYQQHHLLDIDSAVTELQNKIKKNPFQFSYECNIVTLMGGGGGK